MNYSDIIYLKKKVKSNTGADGEGSYYVQQPKTSSGESSLYSAIFQVYGAENDLYYGGDNDPSICEVYAVISREVRTVDFKNFMVNLITPNS